MRFLRLYQVLEWLITDPEGVYVDCTLGGGGHSAALLEALGQGARVVGLDRDPDALREASKRLSMEVYHRELFIRIRFSCRPKQLYIAVVACSQTSALRLDMLLLVFECNGVTVQPAKRAHNGTQR